MGKMKDNPDVVAVLIDVVSSRHADRIRQHADLLSAIEAVNAAVRAFVEAH